MQFKLSCRGSAVLALTLIILLGQAHAAWVGEEGEMWLKWGMTTRNAYVNAYVAGTLRGFSKGCSSGVDYLSSKKGVSAKDAEEYLTGAPP